SRIVHSWVLARSDRVGSWRLFTEALQSDVADIQGGTTPEGIHLGAMAGVLDLLTRGYVGIEPRGNVLWFNPVLPEELARLRMQMRYRGHTLDLEVTSDRLTIITCRSAQRPIKIGFRKDIYDLEEGDSMGLEL
ncbi:MAG: glycosyl hydrolase family 65 protein, partial [Syntrophobacteria bacterium]